ncbi:hypothetical protein B0O99DRAFT_547891 [Bisporella sp. PMI_857]|nr:hypothetical protein B0O99DRAFT_547891 [Bisporella sp. PMI_857]
MSKKFKSQASSSRAVVGTGFTGFGVSAASSSLSYLSNPSDFSSISDGNVVVSFKNLSKKDGTTKSKALDDLRTYVQAHPYEIDGGVEEAILEAWVAFYPRISVDNSRRVRELSHNLQYELLKSARKRMEKHIPKVVGSWLAGTYDRDKAVSRAASDGVASFLDNQKKVLILWTRCQVQILDYALEALNETPQSLSDERITTAEDMKSKYYRVIGSSLSLVLNLLDKLGPGDIAKHQDKYQEFLTNTKRLWEFVSCEDAFVRRTISQLLEMCLGKQVSTIEKDLPIISHAFVSEALRSSQTSSALQVVQALVKLTSRFPQVWTSQYKERRPPISRLRHFVERGSQSGPPSFWVSLKTLLTILPEGVLPTDVESSLEFLKAFRTGISRREEARTNALDAWNSYFETVVAIAGGIIDPSGHQKLFGESIYPIFGQYLYPTPENSQWNIGTNAAALSKALGICSSSKNEESQISFSKEWNLLADNFIIRLNTSLPEQSKDYNKSQTSVSAESHRWFSLVSAVLKEGDLESIRNVLVSSSANVIRAALELLQNRIGKPYSAGATIESALRLAPKLMELSPESLMAINSFLESQLPKLIMSPSSRFLVSALYLVRTLPGQDKEFESIWQSTVDGLLALPDSDSKYAAVVPIISSDAISALAQASSGLQGFFKAAAIKAVHETDENQSWPLFEAAITFELLAKHTEKQLLDLIIGGLDDQISETRVTSALRALEFISQKRPGLLKEDNKAYVALVTKLLSLTELSDDKIPAQASRLRSSLEASDQDNGQADQVLPMLHVIRQNLETATPQSLSIDTILQQASSILGSSADLSVFETLLPDLTIWRRSISSILTEAPSSSLGVMRPFAGAVYLTQAPVAEAPRCERDLNGYSIALRMGIYTARLIGETPHLNLPKLDPELVYLLSITFRLAQDQVDLQGENQLATSILNPDVISEIQEFLFSANIPLQQLVTSGSGWLNDSDASATHVRGFIAHLIDDTSKSGPIAFHAARILSDVLQQLVNEHGWDTVRGESWLQKLDLLKTSTANILGAAAILIGLQTVLATSRIVNNLCNRLISDVAGAHAKSEKSLGLLVLLNASFSVYEDGDLPVAQNRLVFAVKQMLSWTDDLPLANPRLASEACFTLHRLLPAIKEVYGSYWEASLSFCISIWESDQEVLSSERLPMVGMSLKLYTILRTLEDANDDLEDALGQLDYQISQGLINLLRLQRQKENVPQLFVDNVLSREVGRIPLKDFKDNVADIYPLVASEFRVVQSTAFDVLHRALPEQQQQLSVDVLLENRDAQLPEELLSLLLDAPSLDNITDETLAEFPSFIRGYLLSWLLIYDSYSTASFKVCADYSNILKSENYIGPLLDFLFDVLGHSAGYPVNLSNFDIAKIRSYNTSEAEDNNTKEQNMQWLLINLYYLCLKYTPNLAKGWWLDCKSKQTRIAVKSWTEKYFSPLVISDTMDEVTKWADEQETTDDEKELIIKASKKSREVYAGYEVDDMMMEIVIRLPAAYPLEGVKVDGVNRVAVSPQKWTGWLMTTQGAMTFSNGSIIDSLSIFRKNVIGALKGKGECAICYSLISSDKKMPDKGCHTCKNLFHASCLFKWFATSNQSTCPLCRNPFNYGVDARRARPVG